MLEVSIYTTLLLLQSFTREGCIHCIILLVMPISHRQVISNHSSKQCIRVGLQSGLECLDSLRVVALSQIDRPFNHDKLFGIDKRDIISLPGRSECLS